MVSKPSYNTIVYVDRSLAVAIAAKLIGVLQTRTKGTNTTASVSWLISAAVGSQDSSAFASDIRELLPEDLVHLFYSHIAERYTSIEPIIGRLSAGTESGFFPGTVISVQGKLQFPDLKRQSESYSPFTHVDVDLPQVMFHGEQCVVGKLVSGDFSIPTFFAESAKYQVAFCNEQPVEVTGILRWVPPYSPSGGRALNLAIRCAALWLR